MLPETILDGDDCADDLVQRVDAVGRRPGQVVVEFSERGADQDRESLIAAMIACSQRGFGVALDDVGTGNHTREVVEQARPGYLKLDISLVRGIQDAH